MKITTNHHERPLVSYLDMPELERHDFDYILGDVNDPPAAMPEEAYTLRFFRYRGEWYDSHEFELAPHSYRALGWDGVQTQSYWDAIVLRYFDADGHERDGVVVGHATW